MENRIKSLIKKLTRFGYTMNPQNTSHKDPVCGMSTTSDLFKAEYQGQTYYFCSDHCQQQFIEDPETYVS